MIGRHFLVTADSYRRVKRQYTICSAIGENIRTALIQLAQSKISNQENAFDYKVLAAQD